MDPSASSYPTDLTDPEWEAVRQFIPPSRPVGAGRRTSMRAVVNAVFYRRRSGCPWRMLPHDFPHWRTVYGYFHEWQRDGTWARIESAQRRMRCQSRRLETMSNGRRGRAQAQPAS